MSDVTPKVLDLMQALKESLLLRDAVDSYHETNGARQPVEDSMAAVLTTATLRARAIAARRAITEKRAQIKTVEDAEFRDRHSASIREFAKLALGVDPEDLPETEILSSLRLWRYCDSDNPTLAVMVAPGILLSASPDDPDNRFGISLPCPVCDDWMPARRVISLSEVAQEIDDAPDQCDGCNTRSGNPGPRKSEVHWPPSYDEEVHDSEVTQTECLRVIANNLAVIGKVLEDINANGLLR